jgi:hypothetical protein
MTQSGRATGQTATRRLVTVDGQPHLRTTEPGTYHLETAGHRSADVTVPAMPPAIPVTGPWTVAFTPGRGAPASVTLGTLSSWSASTDKGVKYFSGTGTYATDVQVPADAIGPGKRVVLDLGDVRSLAQVNVNGHDQGVLWTPPFQIDVTAALHAGSNRLVVAVTNDWHNRLVGDETEPADVEWGEVATYNHRTPEGRPLVAFPQWLVRHEPRPQKGRFTFTSWNFFTADSKLDQAGLLGPVMLGTQADVAVSAEHFQAATEGK